MTLEELGTPTHHMTARPPFLSTAPASRSLTVASLTGLEGVTRQVEEMDDDRVANAIEAQMVATLQSIMAGNGFSYSVPSGSANNTMYVKELDRIVLKDKLTERLFGSLSSVRKTAMMTRVLELVRQLCKKGIHVTKRDLFYTDVKLFTKQTDSDECIEEAAAMLGCTRASLNVVASEKGQVVGRITFEEAGDTIDCTKMGVGGKAIPPHIDRVENIRGDAKFILIVEKDAAFMRLSEDRFYNQFPCIIITGKGQPDVATRQFLKRVKETLSIPVLALVDSDPYGLKIFSVYMQGSKSMAYDNASLTTPDIKWLGVRPSDLKKYNIPEQCRLDMSAKDIQTGKALLEEDFIKSRPEWGKELQIMLKLGKKAEIQALSSFGFQYLTEYYLPRKLREGDWI